MATGRPRPMSGVSSSGKWSLYAGVYTFVWSVGLLMVLSPVTRTLGTLLQFPAGYAGFIVASPATCIGAIVWWGLVERRETYAYRYGGLFGLVTALLTVLFWLLVLTAIFGSLVVMGLTVVGFVLAVTLPVGSVAGILLLSARRQV